MCGIAGIINLKNKRVNKKNILLMQNAIRHRGPDGSGEFIDNHIGISMRRLSIIDVKGGDQPLFNEDKSIVIVGNGEIYNYLELQKDLVKKGHKLKTGSDIETAIHLYEEYGEKSFEMFRGMFALALYDKKKNLFFLIRDRMGEKPIYYSLSDTNLYFSSELKSICKVDEINKEIDLDAISSYFSLYYIPEPDTPFKNIKKLPAGNFLKLDLLKNTWSLNEYWNSDKIKTKLTSDPIEKLKQVFDETCKLVLRSDVPVGISLSGGIDSGSILAYCAPKYKNLKAFSVGYEGHPPSDEREMAKKLAKKYKIKFFEVEIKQKDVVKNFAKTVKDSDEPIADIASYSIYAVSKLARENGVKVLLNGAGGDELFWGYPSTIEAVSQNLNKNLFDRVFRRGFIYNNPNPFTTEAMIIPFYTSSFYKISKNNKLKNDFKGFRIHDEEQVARNVFDSARNIWLKNDVVTLGDRMSMASSVELRAPYLDYKLIETVLSYKKIVYGYKDGQKKWQKKMFKGILADEVLNRPKKGFTPPVANWIAGIIKKYSKLLKNGFLVKKGILDKSKIKLAGKIINNIPTYTAYQLLVLEIWGRTFVCNEKIK